MKKTIIQREVGKIHKPIANPIEPAVYNPSSDNILMAVRKRRERYMSKRNIPVTNPNPLKAG